MFLCDDLSSGKEENIHRLIFQKKIYQKERPR